MCVYYISSSKDLIVQFANARVHMHFFYNQIAFDIHFLKYVYMLKTLVGNIFNIADISRPFVKSPD